MDFPILGLIVNAFVIASFLIYNHITSKKIRTMEKELDGLYKDRNVLSNDIQKLKDAFNEELDEVKENASEKYNKLNTKFIEECEVSKQLREDIESISKGRGSFYSKSVRDMIRSLCTLIAKRDVTVPHLIMVGEKFDLLDQQDKAKMYKIMYKILGKKYDKSRH